MNEIISPQQIRLAAKGKVNDANMNSVLVALDKFGSGLGIDPRPLFPPILGESWVFNLALSSLFFQSNFHCDSLGGTCH